MNLLSNSVIIFCLAFAALILDRVFNIRLSEIAGIPTSAFSPADYRGLVCLVLVAAILFVLWCWWQVPPTAIHVSIKILGVIVLSLAAWLVTAHGASQMSEVAQKIYDKLSSPEPVTTGSIPPTKLKQKPKPKLEERPGFFENLVRPFVEQPAVPDPYASPEH